MSDLRTPWLASFKVFSYRFAHTCFVVRGVLGVHLICVLSGGLLMSWIEPDMDAWDGIYFALITATSVGYGDITPGSTAGQFISVLIALVGTIFFGLVVGIATRAVTATVGEYRDSNGNPVHGHRDLP